MGVIDKIKLIVKDVDTSKVGYYDPTYADVHKLLEESLDNPDAVKEVINNLDFIWKCTNFSNISWITNDNLLKEKDYITTLINTIDNFRYKNSICLLIFGSLHFRLANTYPELVDELLCSNTYKKMFELGLDTKDYYSIFLKLGKDKQEEFINELVNSNIKIDFSEYPFDLDNKYILEDNIIYLADNTDNLYRLRKQLIEKQNINIDQLNNYIDNNIDKSFESIVNSSSIISSVNGTIKDIYKMVILDVLDNEKVKLSDINIISNGAFSLVLVIGNKVVKLGKTRVNKSFPNNPYIIKPLLRKTLKDNDNEYFIEVTERVNPLDRSIEDTYPGIIDELYTVYKGLRDLGLVWTDVNYRNVGRLIKDNSIYWKDSIEPSDDVLEFSGKVGTTELKVNDLVILDADHIYYEDDKDKVYPDSPLMLLYEKRYNDEKDKARNIKGYSYMYLLGIICIVTSIIGFILTTYIFMQ